jgi:hypothetical protein
MDNNLVHLKHFQFIVNNQQFTLRNYELISAACTAFLDNTESTNSVCADISFRFVILLSDFFPTLL